MMINNELTIGIIAGEESGDYLGASLIAELRNLAKDKSINIVGIGGKALQQQGLNSFFDMSEISLVGIAQILTKLPKLIYYIHKTVRFFLKSNIDCLIVIDSPDFTHRVAKKLKKIKKILPIIQYIAPSVWAWREKRAQAIKPFIDELLAILPFEPEILEKLNGPKTTYVGHSLTSDENIKFVRKYRAEKKSNLDKTKLLLLPGSRRSEIVKLMPIFYNTSTMLKAKNPKLHITIVTLPHLKDLIKKYIKTLPCTIVTTKAEKWQAFAEADIALAANGTVSFELALCNIPMVLAYKLDILANYFIKPFIKIWSAALPNIIMNKPFIPEYYNEYAKPIILAKQLEYLLDNKLIYEAQMQNFTELYKIMRTSEPSEKIAAKRILQHLHIIY